MSQLQRVKIRLQGCNEFEETFHASSVKAALKQAKNIYPEAKKISWVGGASEPSYCAPAPHYEEFDYGSGPDNKGVDGGFASNISSSVSSGVSNAEGGGLILMLMIGGFAVVAAIGVAILTFPGWLGALTAKASTKLYNRFNPNPKFALSLLLAVSTYAGGFAGAVAIQNEYAPEVTQSQVEIIESFRN